MKLLLAPTLFPLVALAQTYTGPTWSPTPWIGATPAPTTASPTPWPTTAPPTPWPTVPPTWPPTATPSSAPVAEEVILNCDFRSSVEILDGVTLQAIVNQEKGTYLVQVTLDGEGWLGFGRSDTGMVGGQPIIAKPDEPKSETNPGIYQNDAKAASGINLLDDQSGLLFADFVQEGGKTILTYEMELEPLSKLAVDPSASNTFIVAYGDSNTFGYHGSANRGATQVTMEQCIFVDAQGNIIPGQEGVNVVPVDPPSEEPAQEPPANEPAEPNIVGQLDCTFRNAVEPIDGVSLSHIVNQDEGTITVEVVADGERWIAFGRSTGGMVGGEVIIAKPNDPPSATNPGKYAMTAQSASGVSLVDAQTLIDASFEQVGGKTILRFTKLLNEPGELAYDPTGPNNFIVAMGFDNDFGYHGNTRGAFVLPSLNQCLQLDEFGNVIGGDEDADVGAIQQTLPPYREQWLAHGWLMAISWVVLVPIAIGASLLRDWIPGDGTWFKIHMYTNSTAFLCMCVAFGLAVNNIQKLGGQHFDVVQHRKVGLAIFVLVFVQVLSGWFRPHLPHTPTEEDVEDQTKEEPKKSIARRIFEVEHRILGVGVLGLAWYNCYTGIKQFSLFYGEDNDKTNVLFGVIGGLSGLIVVLWIVKLATTAMKKSDTSE